MDLLSNTPSSLIYKQKSTKKFGPKYKQKSSNLTLINFFSQKYPYTCIRMPAVQSIGIWEDACGTVFIRCWSTLVANDDYV
jgi:hypothetical protein